MIRIPCGRWEGNISYFYTVFLSLLAITAIVVGVILLTAPMRRDSVFMRLEAPQRIGIGLMALLGGLFMLLLAGPPVFGFNRCK